MRNEETARISPNPDPEHRAQVPEPITHQQTPAEASIAAGPVLGNRQGGLYGCPAPAGQHGSPSRRLGPAAGVVSDPKATTNRG